MAGSSYSVVDPPRGCNHAARTSTHDRRGGTGHFYIKARTALNPYGLAARVLAIGSKQKSAALRAGFCNVAEAAVSARLLLSARSGSDDWSER
jgi:hypothetical protein